MVRLRRVVALLSATAVSVVGSSVVCTAPAVANTIQSNGCLGVTGSFAQFAVPIAGTASPSPATTGQTITLSHTSVAVSVSAALISLGVAFGVVSAADSLADLGVTANDGTANQSAGINQVSAAAGTVTLKISATNTTQGTQATSNPAPASSVVYVTADAGGGNVQVYTSVTNPPKLGGPNAPDPSRTGTLLTGSLNVAIGLKNTTWTPKGAGTVTFSEQHIRPASLTAPSVADRAAAPLIALARLDGNGTFSVPFYCWPGTVNGALAPAPLVPGASTAIAAVTVTLPTPAAPGYVHAQPGFTTSTTGPITVSYSAPANHGSVILRYTATCISSNGGTTRTGVHIGAAAAPITVTGATLRHSYTCTVRATNVKGTGPPSPPSNAIIVGAPIQVAKPAIAKIGVGKLQVAFANLTAAQANGSPLTTPDYTATCKSTNGGVTRAATRTGTPITVSALTAGKTYTCTVYAHNARGNGNPSPPSASHTA